MTYNLPNILTLLRIALIPVFVIVFYLPVSWSASVAAAIFFFAGVTDWLDGYLARRLKVTSAFGAFLDPVADKLIVATGLVLIVENNPTPWDSLWLALPAVIIIGREITISALREWMAGLGARTAVAVNMTGKLKTSAQLVALLLLIYRQPIFGLPTIELGFALLYLAAILTLWSMIIYLKAALPMLVSK